MITLKKEDDDSNIESYCVTNDERHPRMRMRKKKTKQRRMTKNGPFVSFCPFWPGFGLSGLVMAFWPVFGLSDTLYNLTICEKDVICVQSSNCQHDLQESLQKLSNFIVWGEVPCQIS